MKFISHRGNVNGPSASENKPEYILHAVSLGYDVEVDVWFEANQLFLGHDSPTYKVDLNFLLNDQLWCHCKNVKALNVLLDGGAHCFFHETDDVVLTSRGFLWTYPGKELTKNSICVLPELGFRGDLDFCYGICSDFIGDYKK